MNFLFDAGTCMTVRVREKLKHLYSFLNRCMLLQEQQAVAEDVQVCREALELLTVCLALSPQAIESLNKDKAWQIFIIDVLILCRSR